jgi:DNA-binding response OmpR family regulator
MAGAAARRILVVDDDDAIIDVVRMNLEAEGFGVDTAGDGESALSAFDPRLHAMAIVDVNMPGIDGFETARRIRSASDVPILMLSVRDSDVDKAVGLGVGADDYLTKPFSPLELVARVKAHLRRYAAGSGREGPEEPEPTIEAGPVTLDIARHEAVVGGERVDLTATEFKILALLAAHPGRVYTKAQIYESVWGEDFGGDYSTVQVHITRLRKKIEADPAEPVLIGTVWGIGYRFESEGPA